MKKPVKKTVVDKQRTTRPASAPRGRPAFTPSGSGYSGLAEGCYRRMPSISG